MEGISNSIQWQSLIHKLNDRRSSGRVICDEYKAKGFGGNSNSKFLHTGNYKRLVLADLIINSFTSKFDTLILQINGNNDNLILSEKKVR